MQRGFEVVFDSEFDSIVKSFHATARPHYQGVCDGIVLVDTIDMELQIRAEELREQMLKADRQQ